MIPFVSSKSTRTNNSVLPPSTSHVIHVSSRRLSFLARNVPMMPRRTGTLPVTVICTTHSFIPVFWISCWLKVKNTSSCPTRTTWALCKSKAPISRIFILIWSSVDESILQHMIDTGAEFLMEVTDKTKADIKGGTLIGNLQ